MPKTNVYQCTGRENDGIGTVYYRARVYHPYLHRFLSEDPIEFVGDELNLYRYTFNNPIANTDPTGLWRMPDFVSVNVNVAIPTPWTGTLVGVTGAFSFDRYGNMYWGAGPNVGKAATFVSGSAALGWLNQKKKPRSEELNDFLSAHGFRATGGFWFGGGLNYSPGTGGTATTIGLFTPQAGGGYTYSLQQRNAGFAW